jgi:hypothetical protein
MRGKLQAVRALTLVFLITACGPYSSELRERCAEANKKGMAFLAANQRDGGGFVTDVWDTIDPKQRTTEMGVLTIAQILYSVTFCPDTEAGRGLRERAAAYLLAQREPPGVWRYVDQSSAHYRISPDVDDTVLAWAALCRLGHRIDADALGALRASRNESGLFNTWIGDRSTWEGIDSREIDAVVNLNALFLFALGHESVEDVCHYILTQAESGKFRSGSLYYPALAFTHAFSRAYGDGGAKCLENAVPAIRATTLSLQQSDGGWGDDVETARGMLTLLNIGYRGTALDRAVNAILVRQTSDGGWALAPAYTYDAASIRCGSRCFTTALCLEALAKYCK